MFTNEDVLNQLPNDVVRSAFLEIVDKNIPRKDYTLQVENGSAKGDNYIGIVYRLSVTYKTIDQYGKSKSKKFGIFAKVAPDSPIRRKEFFARPCFLRECFIYDEYLPLLVKFQESKGIIPTVNGFSEFVKCYKTLTDDMKEGILMEDLKLKGFVMNNRLDQPSVEVVRLVMKTLGKLHAISFALKDQCPNQFAKFTKLEEVFAHKSDDKRFVNYLNSQKKLAYGALSRPGDEKYLKRVQTFFQSKPFYDHMLYLLDGSRAEPYATVCHGDCWNNNILFKYDNESPSDIRLLDWQFTRYASPVCDLMYYIFCCTTKGMRDEYYKKLIDEYHSEFTIFLGRLGSDSTVLFPRTALDDQLNRFGAFALLIGLMAIPTIMTKEEDVPDLDEISTKHETGDEEFTRQEIQQNINKMSTNEKVLQELPNDAVRVALLDVIEKNIHNNVYSLNIEQGSAKGDNYIGVVYRLIIAYMDADKEPKKAGLFIKVPPENLSRRQLFFARPCFLRESLMYDEFLPLLVEFQISKGIIPNENGFSQFATCYKTLTDDMKEAVFMEDLSLKGYVMHSRFKDPSFDLAKVLYKSLGKFHALSFALKDQWPERFAKFREIDEVLAQKRENDVFFKHVNGLTELAYQVLSKKEDEEYLNICKTFFQSETVFELLAELTEGSKAEPYAVVCHGDCWNNNMLFKYDDEKPVDVKLIDWQVARYASPICDLMYYMFGCTTKAFRDAHFHDLLNLYHAELSSFLQRLGSDPDVLFPRSALDDQFNKFGSIGLVLGLILIPTITINSDDIPDLDDMSAILDAVDKSTINESYPLNELGSSKLRDVIIDHIKLGTLQNKDWSS